uniref:Cytochrome P450 n=1 Tax=Steinernema glaseri TaxID=37863 RepID=A0A1I7ZFA1_9BILA
MQVWQIKEIRGNRGIVFSEGPGWQEQRRFSLQVLRNFGVGRNLMQERILEELQYRFSDLELELKETPGGKKVMNLAPMLDLLVGSIINLMVAGYRYDKTNEEEFFHLKHQLDLQLAEGVGSCRRLH